MIGAILGGAAGAVGGELAWRCARTWSPDAPSATTAYPRALLIGLTFMTLAGLGAVHGVGGVLPPLLLTGWALVVASSIDLAHRIIPNRLTYPLAPAVLVLLLAATLGTGRWVDFRRAILAGVVVPGGMLLLSEGYRLVRGRAGIGMGDIKLAASIGLVVGYLGGWEIVVFAYAAVITSVVVAVGLTVAGRARLASRIPFGPYLSFGAILAMLAGDSIGRWLAVMLGV